MGSFISFLENNTTLLLFLVIAIGYILAKIKIKGFSLGISSVLFVGLAFGSLSEKLIVPDAIFIIGLIFFIYTTGLQSGPGFFASFNRVGMGYNLLAVICLFITAAFVFILRNIIDLEPRILAGLYSGALTNTPAIASIVDSLKLAFSNLPESEMNMILGEPVAGFSIAYPFGVLGVIFAFQIFKFLFKINVEKESREIATELGLGGEELENRDIKVIQKEVIGKSIQEIFQTKPYSKFLVSRIKKNDQIQIVTGKTILEKDDIITVVGSYAKIEEYSPDFGVYVETTISSERGKLDYRRIFVSNKDVIGISIRDLNLREKFDATITRLKRGDSEIVPTQDTILLAGDRIRVVARKKDMENVTKFFGDS
ncbi:MAG: hypothetical protein KDK36_06440, partial [Leptospiraceae bacterium]|nr:hypothetical protein [Leptospiraceae bacterium]